MIQLGDILLIEKYKDEEGTIVNSHPFIVVDNKNGIIEGYSYDIAGNFISSIKNMDHKLEILRYRSNMLIDIEDGVLKESFIKAGILYYFDTSKIKYKHIGNIGTHAYNQLIHLLELLDEAQELTNNLNNIN